MAPPGLNVVIFQPAAAAHPSALWTPAISFPSAAGLGFGVSSYATAPPWGTAEVALRAQWPAILTTPQTTELSPFPAIMSADSQGRVAHLQSQVTAVEFLLSVASRTQGAGKDKAYDQALDVLQRIASMQTQEGEDATIASRIFARAYEQMTAEGRTLRALKVSQLAGEGLSYEPDIINAAQIFTTGSPGILLASAAMAGPGNGAGTVGGGGAAQGGGGNGARVSRLESLLRLVERLLKTVAAGRSSVAGALAQMQVLSEPNVYAIARAARVAPRAIQALKALAEAGNPHASRALGQVATGGHFGMIRTVSRTLSPSLLLTVADSQPSDDLVQLALAALDGDDGAFAALGWLAEVDLPFSGAAAAILDWWGNLVGISSAGRAGLIDEVLTGNEHLYRDADAALTRSALSSGDPDAVALRARDTAFGPIAVAARIYSNTEMRGRVDYEMLLVAAKEAQSPHLIRVLTAAAQGQAWEFESSVNDIAAAWFAASQSDYAQAHPNFAATMRALRPLAQRSALWQNRAALPPYEWMEFDQTTLYAPGDLVRLQDDLQVHDPATYMAFEPEASAVSFNLAEQTRRVLSTMTPREEAVLRIRFGVGTDEDNRSEKVWGDFEVTRERIRQIEAKALRKLSHPGRTRRLSEFVDPDAGNSTPKPEK